MVFVRSLCTYNYWAAACFGSGVISLLDLRMGPLLRMWQAHDNEVLSSIPVAQGQFVTSSLDQTIAVSWILVKHKLCTAMIKSGETLRLCPAKQDHY